MADDSQNQDDQQASLSTLYTRATNLTASLDSLDHRSEQFKTTLATATALLTQCRTLVAQHALFSPNESLEDLSTATLAYMNIPYALCELVLKTYDVDRRAQLRRAVELLEEFLGRCEDYELLGGEERRLWARAKEEGDGFRVVGAGMGAEGRRDVKVRRFREEKAIKERLQILREQSQSINVDEEVVRKLYLSEIQLNVHQSFQTLDMIGQEMEILASTPQPVPERSNGALADADTRVNGRAQDGFSERLDGPTRLLGRTGNGTGPLLDPKGKPLQPFTITDRRTQLQKGVFRPGHSLPTMSIDEYLEEERRRGGIIDGGGNADAAVQQPDEDDMDAQDEATMKAREWDEFVEANPKGAGNTLNRG